MDAEVAEILAEVLADSGEEANVYQNYSGRGMYGKETTGVTFYGSMGDLVSAIINSAHEFVDVDDDFADAKFNIGTLRTDSMGKGIIIY